MLETFEVREWNEPFAETMQQEAIHQLENGSILFFPQLAFRLLPEENYFLSPDHADPHAKNISYYAKNQTLWGVQRLTDEQRLQLINLLDRFSWHAARLIKTLLPCYANHLTIGRTSFRPVQISGRKT